MTPQIYLIPCVCSLMFDLLQLPELLGTKQTKQIYNKNNLGSSLHSVIGNVHHLERKL